MQVKACLNGARDVSSHPRLSADPDELAREAAAAVAAGAFAVHLHPKDAAGRDSLAPDDVDRFVTAARAAVDVPIGITTGAWTGGAVARMAAIRGWRELPDFASVNAHEDGAEQVAALLLERGVAVEAGVWHDEGLRRWMRWSDRSACLRVLVEIQDAADPVAVEALARRLVDGARSAEPDVPVLLHGEERATWPAIDLAIAWRLPTRAGLEDTLTLPDGSVAADSAALVRAVLERAG
ncbi:MAG: 3-keto-5-aminohexanoate cleavage protein [Actinomycetota bacterium]